MRLQRQLGGELARPLGTAGKARDTTAVLVGMLVVQPGAELPGLADLGLVELAGAAGRADEAGHHSLQVQGQGLLAQLVLEQPGHLDQQHPGALADLGGGHLVEAERVGDAIGEPLVGARGYGGLERDGGAGPGRAGLAGGPEHDQGSSVSAPGSPAPVPAPSPRVRSRGALPRTVSGPEARHYGANAPSARSPLVRRLSTMAA